MARIATKFIASNAVTNAKLATVANNTVKGNVSGSTATPIDLTATQLTTIPNAFVGDSGSGGTKGMVPAPPSGSATLKFLRANGTWSAVDLDAYEATATATATTTSSSSVLITGMTETPPAGTYLAMFSSVVACNNTNANVTIALYSAGSLVTHTVRTVSPQFVTGVLVSASINIPVYTQCIVTVNGSQAITAQWSTSAGTASIFQRSFDVIRIA